MGKIRYTASKALLASFGTVLSLVALATSICNSNVNAINTALGTTSWEQVNREDGESQDTEYFKSKYTKIDDLISDTDKLIEEVVEEGAVLLKNENNALPLAKNSKVTTVGIASTESTLTSSGSVAAESGTGREVTLKAGLEHAGLEVNQTAWDFYSNPTTQTTYGPVRNGMMVPGPLISRINEVPWSVANEAFGSTLNQYGDAVIFNITRVSGEGNKDVNRSGTEDTPNGDALTLSNDERETLRALKALKDNNTIKKVIVLLNCTASIDLDFLNDSQYGVDACLQVQSVGTTGFNGVGDLLVGNVSPSGKSNDTLWYSNSQNPTLTNQLGYEFTNASDFELHTATNGSGTYEQYYVVYQEGIYLGYRYTETRYEDYVVGKENVGNFDYSETVAIPFGYGESYSEFEYSNYQVRRNGDNYTVSVDVKNIGDVAAKEVVQVYLQKPYGTYNIENDVEASAVELVGYDKTELLDPSESVTITIDVDGSQFASYDATDAKTYVLTEGDYYLAVGNGAHDATNNILAAKGYSPSNTSGRMDAVGNSNLAAIALTQNSLDTEKYSKSEATGNEITNLFDDSDLNKYSETKDNSPVTYITRNNWAGTVVLDPLDNNTNYTKIELTEKMLQDFRASWEETELKEDDVEYPTYGVEANLNLIDMRVDREGNPIPYEADVWDRFMDQLTWDETVNLLSNGMRMTTAIPTIVKPGTLDHNGPLGVTEPFANGTNGLAAKNGVDSSVRPSTFPAGGVLASSMNHDLLTKVGEMYGENCLWAGYNGLYGPAVNLHRSQYSSRNPEYYSEDGFLSGHTSADLIKAMQEKGTYAYIKHFVLNDQETHRYGLSTWLNEQSFRELYLEPFYIAINEGGAHAMMSSYNRVGTSVPGGKSNLLTDWLRGEAGFDGFVVTDMYQLGSYGSLTFYLGLLRMPLGVFAGNDLVDGSINNAAQFDPYKENHGELAWKMRESAKRILYTVCHTNAMNGYDSNTTLVEVLTWWQISLISIDVVFAVLTAGALALFVYDYYLINIKGKKKED